MKILPLHFTNPHLIKSQRKEKRRPQRFFTFVDVTQFHLLRITNRKKTWISSLFSFAFLLPSWNQANFNHFSIIWNITKNIQIVFKAKFCKKKNGPISKQLKHVNKGIYLIPLIIWLLVIFVLFSWFFCVVFSYVFISYFVFIFSFNHCFEIRVLFEKKQKTFGCSL